MVGFFVIYLMPAMLSDDPENDDKISRAELIAGLKPKGLMEWQIDRLLKALDVDKDGLISEAEWSRRETLSASVLEEPF